MSARFLPGEILEAVIAGPVGRRGVLVRLPTGFVVAETDIPLQVNERLRVKVEQMQPKVMLRILDRNVSEVSKIDEYLRLYRADPKALLKSFSLVNEIFGVKGMAEAPNDAVVADLLKIMQNVSSMVLSRDTATNPMFIRDFISGLGLLLERRLAGNIRSGRRSFQDIFGSPDDREGGLKAQLLRLLASLAMEVDENGQTNQAGATRNRGINQFAKFFIESIETFQVLNVHCQENEQKYFLQIPCQMPDGLRMQDLIVEWDGDGENTRATGESCRFILFMDMDILGRLMIDAALSKTAINCHIRCGEDATADFLSSYLDQLKSRLTVAGYRVGALTLETDGDIESTRYRYFQERVVHAADTVNLFA
ncbi:MAG: hypothetical protein JW950_04225 [Deltaproteobacteria bacterium]|nr:hypothetical protein [Deltaproteobacteria bacterium]